jgi:hypothetical protein
MRTIVLLLTSLFMFSSVIVAQEEARAAWQVTNFDITANVQPAERTLAAVAILTATNVGKGTGSSFTFRITNKVAVKSVTVGGANAGFRTVPESYATCNE